MILAGVQWVVERSRQVRIDRERLTQICEGLDPRALSLPDWRIPVVPAWHDERLVDWVLLFTSINFCYWGEPKWTVDWHGRAYDGAFGMMAALSRAVEEGVPVLDGAFLARVEAEPFRHILRGNVPIPLEPERLDIWHEVGSVLVREFRGRWHELVRRAGGSAVRLVHLLVAHMPSFDDTWTFDGRAIAFYKRAQLAAGMLYEAFGGSGWGAFRDFDQLTVFADYKLPQILRKLGILVYDRELAQRVDNKLPIAAGSRAEVEIRAATVWAAELMRREWLPRAPGLTAAHVDFWLWAASQVKAADDRPYHRTRTTAY